MKQAIIFTISEFLIQMVPFYCGRWEKRTFVEGKPSIEKWNCIFHTGNYL